MSSEKKPLQRLILSALLFLVVLPGTLFAQSDPYEAVRNQAHTIATNIVENLGAFSIQYALMSGGEIIVSDTLANSQTVPPFPLDGQTFYGIGSTSKMFTTTAIMLLVDQGKIELDEAVIQLDERYDELKSAARRRLGSLFNATDYPATLRGWFDVSHDFPSVEPPEYLRQLSPQLYQQEAARVAARFDEAVQLAEQAFTEELSKLVSHLTERLSGADDGKPKIFRDSVVENLREFFDRFRHLNIRSDEQLDDLVGQAQRVIRGVEPQQLRDNRAVRQEVAAQLSSVQSVLDGLLVDRPRRNILRRGK